MSRNSLRLQSYSSLIPAALAIHAIIDVMACQCLARYIGDVKSFFIIHNTYSFANTKGGGAARLARRPLGVRPPP